jgi:uncharacterized protein (TIGR02391 family)
MKVKDLLFQLNQFEKALDVYHDSLSDLDGRRTQNNIFSFGQKDKSLTTKDQSKTLLRMLAVIEPYLQTLGDIKGHVPISSLSKRISFDSHSFFFINIHIEREIIPLINLFIGKLSSMDQEQEIIINNNIIDNKINHIMFHYLDFLHPKIKEASNQLFLDGHYHQAIEAAIKAINQYIRDKTGLKYDGVDLINRAFTSDKDISKRVLVFSDLSTETLLNEQIGFAEMLRGFTKGVRNVLAHSPAQPEDPQKAFEYLTMASLFCRRIDDTYKENLSQI